MATVLVSIKPVYARMIIDGRKAFELRRGRSSIRPGDSIYLYSSSPEKRLVASATVRSVVIGSAACVHRTVGSGAGISRRQLFQYCEGSAMATALELEAVRECVPALTLVDLRRLIPRFVVPQSYRFLSQSEAWLLPGGGRARQYFAERIGA